MEKESIYVGIDLGTTYTKAAYNSNVSQCVETLTFSSEDQSIRSTVDFNSYPVKVATESITNISEVKRILGVPFGDDSIVNIKSNYADILEDTDGFCYFNTTFQGRPTPVRPVEISAIILSHVKKQIIESVNFDPQRQSIKVVVTHPVFFDQKQRDLTEEAAKIADLDVIGLISEPTAAAYNYSLKNNLPNGMVFFFDFGGGTLDTAVGEKTGSHIKFCGIHGDKNLGGIDIDIALLDYVMNEWKEYDENEVNNLFEVQNGDSTTIQKKKVLRRQSLKNLIENAKIELSVKENVTLKFTKFGSEFELTITRDILGKCCLSIFRRCEETIKETLKKGNIRSSTIKSVVLIGGSSQIPEVKKMLRKVFPDRPLLEREDSNLVIAKGACLYARDVASQTVKNHITQITARDVNTLMTIVDIHKHKTGNVLITLINKGTPLPVENVTFSVPTITPTVSVILTEDRSLIGIFETTLRFNFWDKITFKFEVEIIGKIKLVVLDKDGNQDPGQIVVDLTRNQQQETEEIEKYRRNLKKYLGF
ncbi:heat shock 70 kDa protein, putative [Entamoeba invadens IP1]|uniref:Heat shock 70 kDa protein, putative n=1 Tax=Entamoeba invadens IP1 TaxID=370355 RepID=A0A0A1U0H4_ENTIV|nr:heat shock 70 kDa protein, putative [Entamoeba invadens IP1]ELP84407.1 heat shock 70 kDa protein, putative [Entamoeba invadens IP1]|eukprot:XP_004183753.1 heat shock 70 kDa protein, putative [Entamoeba invadens IP1]